MQNNNFTPQQQSMNFNLQKNVDLDEYSKQIGSQYFSNPEFVNKKDAFTIMHSDYLNIQVRNSQLYAKNTFKAGDIILEFRGKFTTTAKMNAFETFNFKKLGLLWINKQSGDLLLPNKLGKLFLTQTSDRGNCILKSHYNSKILLICSKTIIKGEKFEVNRESIDTLTY